MPSRQQVKSMRELSDLIVLDKLIVVEFEAEWCAPCSVIKPYIQTLIADYPDVHFVSVDVDEVEEASSVLGVNSMPTFVFYRKGQKLDEFIGAHPDKLLDTVKRLEQMQIGDPVFTRVGSIEDLRKIKLGDQLACVLYGSPWSAESKKAEELLEGLVAKYPDVNFAYVDIASVPDAATTFDIRSTPTFDFYRQGQKIYQVVDLLESSVLQSVERLRFLGASANVSSNLAVEVVAAANRIWPYVLRTPLMKTRWISRQYGVECFLKLESEQTTGSFKYRGATNKILTAHDSEKASGFITASTGNHGLGVAMALERVGNIYSRSLCNIDQTQAKLRGIVVLPTTAPVSKVNMLKLFENVEIVHYGANSVEAEAHARRLSEETGRVFVSPYNDYAVAAGQGTVGLEILEQLPEVDAIFVSVGGGGLISGIGAYVKAKRPECKIIGCMPEDKCAMYEAVKTGQVLPTTPSATVGPSLTDGIAAGIESHSFTIQACKEVVDHFILVSETEIKQAILTTIKLHHKVVEGAAGVALAGAMKGVTQFGLAGKKVVVVMCGANLDLSILTKLLQESDSVSSIP